MATKQSGSVRRVGSRYGRTVRSKVGKVETELKKKHKCPYCNSPSVKRQAVGIWTCTKCENTFAAKAYTAQIDKR